MNTPAVCQHASSYDDAGWSLTCTNVLLFSSWSRKHSSWVLNTYTFISPKLGIFAGKILKIHLKCLVNCQIYGKHCNTAWAEI